MMEKLILKEAWANCKNCSHLLFCLNGIWKHCLPIIWSEDCNLINKNGCDCKNPEPNKNSIRIQTK